MCPSRAADGIVAEQACDASADGSSADEAVPHLDWTITPDVFQTLQGNACCQVSVATPRVPETPRPATGPSHRVHLRRTVAIKPRTDRAASDLGADGENIITVSAKDFRTFRGNTEELVRRQVVARQPMPAEPIQETNMALDMSFRSKHRLRCLAPAEPRDPWQGLRPADDYFQEAEGNLIINQVWVRPDKQTQCRERSSSIRGRKSTLVGSSNSPPPRLLSTPRRTLEREGAVRSPARSPARCPIAMEPLRTYSCDEGIACRPGSGRPASRPGSSRASSGSSRRVSSSGPPGQGMHHAAAGTQRSSITVSSVLPPLAPQSSDSPAQCRSRHGRQDSKE